MTCFPRFYKKGRAGRGRAPLASPMKELALTDLGNYASDLLFSDDCGIAEHVTSHLLISK